MTNRTEIDNERVISPATLARHRQIARAAAYYGSSALTLLRHTQFWKIPLLLVRHPLWFGIRTDSRRDFLVNGLMDVWMLKETAIDRDYEYGITPDSSWTVIDIGAGIGDFSISMAGRVDRVIAFEADAERCRLAKQNVERSGASNIKLVHRRVGGLDQLWAKEEMTHCDLLKLDCEGCEYGAFADASDSVLATIDRIVMEYHRFDPIMNSRFESLLRKLSQSGFQLEMKPNPVHRNIGLLFARR